MSGQVAAAAAKLEQARAEGLGRLSSAVQAWRDAEAAAEAAKEAAGVVARGLHDEGVSEYAMAEACGLSRATVRKWMGK